MVEVKELSLENIALENIAWAIRSWFLVALEHYSPESASSPHANERIKLNART